MKISLRKLNVFILLNLIIFQDVLNDNGLSFMTYFDEIVVLLLFGYSLLHKTNGKFRKKDIQILVLTLVYYIWGWVCQFKFSTQPMSIAFKSSLLSIKFFLLLSATLLISKHTDKLRQLFKDMYQIELVEVLVVSAFVLITESLNLSVFIWPWDLCAKSMFLILITLLYWNNSRKDYICILLCIALLLSTGKAKAFAALGIVALVIILIVKFAKKIKWYHVIVMGGAAIALAWNKIFYYYINGYGRYARSVLTLTGFKIANDHIPFGLGWGSFGSYYSGVNYSDAYFMYGLNAHGEVGEATRAFLMDTYWPSVLGETGWLGCFIILILLYIVFSMVQKQYRLNIYYYAAGITGFAYLLVTTLEESGVMQPNLIWLALVLGVVAAGKNKNSIK